MNKEAYLFFITFRGYIVSHRSTVIRLWLSLHFLVFLAGLSGLFWGLYTNMGMGVIVSRGSFWGKASLIFLSAALLPGIFGRMKLLPILTQILMLFRRHLGISMFLTAFNHFLWSSLTADLVSGTVISRKPTYIIMGISALALALPLFLTSNDAAIRILKRNWKRLQRLVYAVLLLVLMHLVFLESDWGKLAGTVLGLEVLSWVMAYKNRGE